MKYGNAAKDPFDGPDYMKLSAKSKMDLLWPKITAKQTPSDWPFTLFELLSEPMCPTFEHFGDQMPRGVVYGQRNKVFHNVGAVG
jgi:hypothetical protein